MYSPRYLFAILSIFVAACKSIKPAPATANTTNRIDTAISPPLQKPDDNRFTKTVLSDDLNEPMELAVAPDGRVFFTERTGKCYVYSPATNSTRFLREFPVKAVEKYLNGLIGVTLDPNFSNNRHIYFFYSSSTGDQYHQNVSRFTLTSSGELDTTSEKIIIKIPIDLEVSAHTGGSLAWDRDGNLYISTGDNTVPFESDGYAPIDERSGRHTFDAQRSAGNTNDLRGKILRIRPQPDGSYTIPNGNLFPVGTPDTKPEIYVMGCRNPYRISLDTATSTVYWGEIGPDAGQDSRHGPRGYDEINQARRPGNYGWPYFVGDTKAYNDSNFATREIGELFKVDGPENNSPNNTGMKKLPPPTSAMIWYPYAASEQFPLLGEGGRCAMGGPFYHYNKSSASAEALPEYYDRSLFIYDWMRNWVFVVRTDEEGNYRQMERFMEKNGDFRRPVDIEIAQNGVMYMLEYGSVYGIDNLDARLVKITYNGGNRAPVAIISASDTTGVVPSTINLNASTSYDFDNDPLTYEWFVNGQKIEGNESAVLQASQKGVYNVVLKVTDSSSAADTDTLNFIAGNTPPQIQINTSGNSTFFFEKPTQLKYDVKVIDKEEPNIDPSKLKVTLNYIPKVAPREVGHQQLTSDYNLGKILVAGSDCKACHQVDDKSVGPSFMDVSRKYRDDVNAPGYLANKIITGGGGVWGEHAMSAHPQLTKEEATEMAKYVLSVSLQQQQQSLKASQAVVLTEHDSTSDQARYIITASYTDDGNDVKSLTTTTRLILRPSKLQGEDADSLYKLDRANELVYGSNEGAFLLYKNIDLTDVKKVTYRLATRSKAIRIEMRTGSLQGRLLNTVTFQKASGQDRFAEVSGDVENSTGKQDIYIIFLASAADDPFTGALDWLKFDGGKTAVVSTTTKPTTKQSQLPTVKKVTAVKPEGERGKEVQQPVNAKELIVNSDCRTCHTQDKKLIGPSYNDVYAKYKGQKSQIKSIAEKIIKGGAGTWGNIPMTPHPQLSKAEAEAMAEYILSGKKID